MSPIPEVSEPAAIDPVDPVPSEPPEAATDDPRAPSALRHSLRFRVTTSFLVAGLILGLVYGGVVGIYLHDMEDQVAINLLRLEAEHFEKEVATDPSATLPNTRLLRGFLVDPTKGETTADLPAPFNEWAGDRGPGEHELFTPDMHIKIHPLENGSLLYLYHFDGEIEPLDKSYLTEILLVGLVLVVLLNGWAGFLLARRVLAPIVNLADQVGRTDPDAMPVHLTGPFYRDEVGALAQALQRAMNRIAEFIDRERRFTRDASHELRTPVTVIKGAAELVRHRAELGQPIQAPLRRIERAVLDMENIIVTFLYLGREGTVQHRVAAEAETDATAVVPVVENLMGANRYLLEEKEVEARLEVVEGFAVAAPEPVISIAIGNLFRNACQYTDRGMVRVCIHPGRVDIIDTGRGMNREAQKAAPRPKEMGFGLGLSIVQDFCGRHGWRLEIESEPGKGTRATLIFDDVHEHAPTT